MPEGVDGVVGPEVRFAALVEEFAGCPGVTVPEESGRRGFGSSALKVNGSIFAMVGGGRLVVNLPRERVDALIGGGIGRPFDTGKGRPMKEWLTVATDDLQTWLALAREALDFVGSPSPTPESSQIATMEAPSPVRHQSSPTPASAVDDNRPA